MMWEQYKEKIGGNLMPLFELMGNKIFDEKFNNNPDAVYKYCIENNVKWEEVLDFKPEYSVDIDY